MFKQKWVKHAGQWWPHGTWNHSAPKCSPCCLCGQNTRIDRSRQIKNFIVGETGASCHTGKLSHCNYLLHQRAQPKSGILVFFLYMVRAHGLCEKRTTHCKLKWAPINHFPLAKVKTMNSIFFKISLIQILAVVHVDSLRVDIKASRYISVIVLN